MRFKYLLLADIHLGNNRNKTKDIVRNLDKFFLKYKNEIITSDMIIIAGDTFDRLLSTNSEESRLAYNWLGRLVVFCKEYGIKLRILEGTPSHDWKQVKLLDNIIESLGVKEEVDYKYFEDLDIEILDNGLSILYIPDEWRPKAKDTYQDVLKKMSEHNLEKVDMIVMHGAFKYQIPGIESDSFHNEDNYVKLTNYTVNCGHVHNRSQYENILVPGSFDRLTFTDEDDIKGGLLVTLENGKFNYKVLENKSALLFKSISLTNYDIKNIKNELDKLAKKYNKGYIRFLVEDKTSITDMLEDLRKLYPMFKLEVKNIKDKDKKEIKLETVKREKYTLDKKTIAELINKELSEQSLDKSTKEIIKEELNKILEEI